MNNYILILILTSSVLFSQELRKEDILNKLNSNNYDSYQTFINTWNKIPIEKTVWEQHRVTPELPLSTQNGEGRINRIEIHQDIPGLYFAGTSGNGLWKSTDFGETWEYLNINDYNFGITDLALNEDKLIVIGGDQKIETISKSPYRGTYYSDDQGESFSEIEINFKPIDVKVFQNGFVIAGRKKIYTLRYNQFQELNLNFSLDSSQNIYNIINYNNKYIGIAIRNDSILSSEYKILKINDGNLEQYHSYSSASEQVRFEPTFSFNRNSDKFLTRILAIKNQTDEFIIEIEFDDNKISENLINFEENFILGQGEFNHAIEVSPIDYNIIYAGGIKTAFSKDGGKTWISDFNGIHVDLHDIAFDDFTGMVWAATDGGLYKASLLSKDWTYASKGITAGQYFWGDISDFTGAEFVGGKMDNGTYYRDFDEYQNIGGSDGMYCFFSEDDPRNLFFSFQRSNIGKIDLGKMRYNSITENLPSENRRPWLTKYNIFSDSSLILYQDQLMRTENNGTTWEKLSVSENDIIFAKRIESSLIFSTEDSIFHYQNLGSIKKIEFDFQITDIIKLENSFLIAVNRESQYSLLQIHEDFSSIGKKIKILEGVSINCLENYKDRVYLGTDDGVFSIDTSLNILSVRNHYDKNNKIRGVRRLKALPNYGWLYAFTFGSGVAKTKLNDCSDNLLKTNYSDTLYKCADQTINFKVTELENDVSYELNNKKSEGSELIIDEGRYLFKANKSNCIYVSQPLYVRNYESKIINIKTSKKFICESEPVKLRITNTDISDNEIIWNNGFIGKEIEIYKSGNYWASYENEFGCMIYSDTLKIEKIEFESSKPELIFQEGKLKTLNDKKVNWFRNGEIVKNNSEDLELEEFGNYQALYFNDTCSIWSENYFHKETGDIFISPNPAYDKIGIDIRIDMKSNYIIDIYNGNGKLVFNDKYDKKGYNYVMLNASLFSPGQYFLVVRGKSIYKTQKFIILN